ncbi:MAG TPA: AMP-binding protein [Burkholderiales bacterium]|nr:AMP-binding protein [Burkholderiales bacterium]
MTAPAAGRGEAPRRVDELAPRGALAFGNLPALVEAGRTLNYRQLAEAVEETAASLVRLSLRPGDRTLIVNENCAAAIVLALAANRCRAWPVLVNARLSAREIEAIRGHSVPRRTFCTVEVSPEAAGHAARLGSEPLALPGVGAVAASACDEAAVPEAVCDAPGADVGALIYTSGTTGAPKGVMLSHSNLLFAARSGATLRRVGSGDRVYAALPISHVFGLASVALSTLFAGAALHLVPRFTPEGFAAALAVEGVSVVPGVPAMYARLLDHARRSGKPLSAPRARFLYAGGAPLDPQLKADVERVFGQPLHNGYGLTETSPSVASTRIDSPRTDLSIGPPVPGIEVRIVDAAGRVVAPGEVGELHIRGPNVMLGYYRAPELTAEVVSADGWFNTGDLARADVDGNLFIAGRTKELIIRSGFNVYPVEVEGVLTQHPDVRQCAVVGRAVPGNEEVVAFVEVREGSAATPAELTAFAAERLAPYKLPAEIVILPTLPASATGKVLKSALRERAQNKPT